MSTNEASDLLATVKWEGASLYETQRGRVKPVVTGIPTAVFWHRWHKLASVFRPQVKAAGITVRRLAKGQWEAVLWPQKSNFALVDALGFTLPEVPEVAKGPF